MKRAKRKYTHKASEEEEMVRRFQSKYTRKPITESPPSAPQSAIDGVKAQSSMKLSEVTEADIALLPQSLKMQLAWETKLRQSLKMPDNLKERTEATVRRFRGY